MATLPEILSGLQTIDSNPNNNTFIDLMRGIAGDPNDAINPEDDPNSIYGKIVEVYNGMVEARSSDEEITAALLKIDGLTVSATSIPSTEPASAALTGSDIQIQIPSGEDGIDGQTPTIALTVLNGVLRYQVTGYTAAPDVGSVVDITNLNTIVDGIVTTNINVSAVNSSITEFTDSTVPAKIVEIAEVTNTKKAEITNHTASKVAEYDANHGIKIADVQTVVNQVNGSVTAASGYATSSLVNKNATASDLVQVTTAADQIAIDKATIVGFKDNVRVDHDRVESWHEDVMFAKETVNMLVRRVMNYTNLPTVGVAGITYVVLEDETQDPIGETHGYRWNQISKEYMRYLSGSAEGENTYTDADMGFVDKDEVLSTSATTLPTAINELVAKEGVANGIATLDSTGTISSAQLPSYVDDVLEVATYAELPGAGETGKIYIVIADETSNNDTSSYRWTGTTYAVVSNTLDGADIKALYEAELDTNAYSDTEKAKLADTETTSQLDTRDVSNRARANHTGTQSIDTITETADLKVLTNAERTKLTAIEENATVDQTGAEIKALYESELDTNAYTDSDKSKLTAIEDSATADQTATEIETLYEGIANTNKYVDAEKIKVGHIAVTQAVNLDTLESDTATNNAKITNVTTDLSNTASATEVIVESSDGTDTSIVAASTLAAGVMTKAMYDEHVANNAKVSDINHNVTTDLSLGANTGTTLEVSSSDGTDVVLPAAATGVAGLLSGTDKDKLDGVENNAKDDQTASEIETLYEGLADTNKYTNSEKALVDEATGLSTVATTIPTAINEVHNQLGTHETDTSTHGVGELVGTTEVQALTNKEIVDPTNHVHARRLDLVCKNTNGVTVPAGAPVKFYEAGGDVYEVRLANQANDVATGVAAEEIAVDGLGTVVTVGRCPANTANYAEGTILYTGDGILTDVEPTTGHSQPIAVVLKDAVDGIIHVLATYPKQDASDVRYDNAINGRLTAIRTQDAIDEVEERVYTNTTQMAKNTSVSGTTTYNRYDRVLGALDVIEMVYTAGDLTTVRYTGDNATDMYYRDELVYAGGNLVEIKHYFGTIDTTTESGLTTLTYDGNTDLVAVSYTEV